MTTLTPNEEIKLLGNMLYATDADDAPRLLSITKRVGEIAAAQPGTVTDQGGAVHLETTPESLLADIKNALTPEQIDPNL